MQSLPLSAVLAAFRDVGVSRVFAKRLAPNDNSKQQVYLGGSFALLNQLPLAEFLVRPSAKQRAVIHAGLPLFWMRADGSLVRAPHSKLILYPQYPEVRWSGFLLGAEGAPADLMNEHARIAGRVLLFGVRSDRTVVARVHAPESPLARELEALGTFGGDGALVPISLGDPGANRDRLLASLREVSAKGWLDPVRLDSTGSMVPCRGRNCGGVTLESYLGISPNSFSEPDFEGWEIKQFGVRNFRTFGAKSPVTLFTPEPTEGLYVTGGVEKFIRAYGYPDRSGIPDRWNFGGRHAIGRPKKTQLLSLQLTGVSQPDGVITDASGGIELVDGDGLIAARWPFVSLLAHWNRKHAQAAYVPSMKSASPVRYKYADSVYLGIGTDFGLLIGALSMGVVYYDPGIKLEEASGPHPQVHRRSQFRVGFKDLPRLYSRFESVIIG